MKRHEILFLAYTVIIVCLSRIPTAESQSCTDNTPCLANSTLAQGKCCGSSCVDSLNSQVYCGGFPACGTNCGLTNKICCFGACVAQANSYACTSTNFGAQCCAYPTQSCSTTFGCQSCSSNTGTCPGSSTSSCSINFLTDDHHCGNCTNDCTATGGSCCNGVCTTHKCGSCSNICHSTETCCTGNVCEDLISNTTHCGACDSPCYAPNNTCYQSQCYAVNCPAGEVSCVPPACVNLQSDHTYCGSCTGSPCGVNEVCCSGVCKAILSDAANCNGCGLACGTGETCSNGVCMCGSEEKCGDGMICCSGHCTFKDNGGNCPSITQFPRCEYDRTKVCARCLPHQSYLNCGGTYLSHTCQVQLSSFSDMQQQFAMSQVYDGPGSLGGGGNLDACVAVWADQNAANLDTDTCYSCCDQRTTANVDLAMDNPYWSNTVAHQSPFDSIDFSPRKYRCSLWCWASFATLPAFSLHTIDCPYNSGQDFVTFLDGVRTGIANPINNFPVFPMPIEQLCGASYSTPTRFCKPHEADELGSRLCKVSCSSYPNVGTGTCTAWYTTQVDKYRPDNHNTTDAVCTASSNSDIVLPCLDKTVSLCGPYSTQTTVNNCQMHQCLFVNDNDLSCLNVANTCVCPGVSSRGGFRCGDPGFTRSLQCTNQDTTCGRYTRGCISNCYFIDGNSTTTPVCRALEDPFDSHSRNTCICIPGSAPSPNALTLPCSGFPRPCTIAEEISCGAYRLSCQVFDDVSTIQCTCHDGIQYNTPCSSRPNTALARPWDERSCELSSELSKCGDLAHVSSCSVVCHPDVRQEGTLQISNQYQLNYPFPAPNNCSLKLDSCVCTPSAITEVLPNGQTFCHDPLLFRVCNTTQYTAAGCNLGLSNCRMNCGANGNNCNVTASTCYAPILSTVPCEQVKVGTSKRLCGHDVSTCTVLAQSIDNSVTWQLAYNSSENVHCTCLPPHTVLPVEYSYYSPCTSASDTNYYCTAAETIQFCGIPNLGSSTVDAYGQWLNDKQEHRCLRNSVGLIAGTCPGNWTIRPCTAQEFYEECPEPNDVMCTMRCSNQPGASCFRIGLCTGAVACNSTDVTTFCSAHARSCSKYTRQTLEGAVVSLVDGSCRCMNGYDGERCEVGLAPSRECTVSESLQFCGPVNHTLDCETDFYGLVGSCSCNLGYGAGTLPCSNHVVECTNTDRLAYLGAFGEDCTLLCNDKETSCAINTFRCFPNGFALGNFPCGTDRLKDRMTLSEVLQFCGQFGVSGFMENVTQINGTVTRIPDPQTCVCDLNHFNDEDGVCRLTFPIRPCTTQEYADYCSATIPCYRKCFIPAPNQPPICDQYYDTSCFNQTYVGVTAASDEVITACGPFVQPGATTATCLSFTNARQYYNCVSGTFNCVCSPSSPPEFQQEGFPKCQFDYGLYYCDTNLPVYPPKLDEASIQYWNQRCNADASNIGLLEFSIFNPITLDCVRFVPSNFYLQCLGSSSPDMTTLQNAEEHCYETASRTFVDWTTSRICSFSGGCPHFFIGGVCCGVTPSAWTLSQAQPWVDTCTTGHTFNFSFSACVSNPTGNTELNQYCGPNAKRCTKRCRLGGVNCFDVDTCVCNPTYDVPGNNRTCRYDYPVDTCLDTPLPHRAQTNVCGVFGQTAVERCIGNSLTVDGVSAAEGGACDPVCQCRSNAGPTPTSTYQCGGYDHPCDPLDLSTFCGTGYVSCTKRCEYPPDLSHIGLRSFCVFNNGSCVLDPVATLIECTADQRALCGDAVAACTAEYSGHVFQRVHCTCTDTGVTSGSLPCNEWAFWDMSDLDPSVSNDTQSCYMQCGPHVLQSAALAYWDINPRGVTYNCAKRRYWTLRHGTLPNDNNLLFQDLVSANFVVWNGTGWSDNMAAIKAQTWVQTFFVGRNCDCMAPLPGGPASQPGATIELMEVQAYSTYAGVETIIQGDYRRVYACFAPYIAVKSDACAAPYFQQCNNPSGPTVCCKPGQHCTGSVGSQTCTAFTCSAGQSLWTGLVVTDQFCSTLATSAHCGSFFHACSGSQTCTALNSDLLPTPHSCVDNSCPAGTTSCPTVFGNPQCCPAGTTCSNNLCWNATPNPQDDPSQWHTVCPQQCGSQQCFHQVCGATGVCCPEGHCVNGLCYSVASCSSGLSFCANADTNADINGLVINSASACVNLQSDANNCGACGNVCPSYSTCSSGKCSECPSGQSFDTYGCCLTGLGCINSALSFGNHQLFLLSDPPKSLHSPYNGMLCSGRGTMAAAAPWPYTALGPFIFNWDGNSINAGSFIKLQLPQASSVCSCYPGWSGTYCEIQNCCRISSGSTVSGGSLCSQSTSLNCRHPLTDADLPAPMWFTPSGEEICNPLSEDKLGGPNCCEFSSVCNTTSWQIVGDVFCQNGGKMLSTARGTICICPAGYLNDGGQVLGTNIPSPFIPPGLDTSTLWDPTAPCRTLFEAIQSSPPCTGHGTPKFQFDSVQRRMIEFCVCDEGYTGGGCQYNIGCGTLGCNPANNHVTGCDIVSSIQCPQTTCTCPHGTVVYGNGCADTTCLNQCVTRTCPDPNGCAPCESGTVTINLFGTVACIDPVCSILKCATQVQCPSGFTFNSITKICELISCNAGYLLDTTSNPTNPVCKKGVCSDHTCTGEDPFFPGAITCSSNAQCSCNSYYAPISDKCRVFKCPCDTNIGSKCLIPEFDITNNLPTLQICMHSNSQYNCDLAVNTLTFCSNAGCSLFTGPYVCPTSHSFLTVNADNNPICIPDTCGCNPCESFTPGFTAIDASPTSYSYQPVNRLTADPLSGNFSTCACAAGSSLCGGLCCPNGQCSNNVCVSNCTVVNTPRWTCVSTASGFWSDDPNSPGQCCDKWTRNGICNGQENSQIPQTTYLYNGAHLSATVSETSGYRDEPICVCDGSHAGPTCQVGTCPLDCSGHGSCINGRCQQASGQLLVCGSTAQYTGCACQFDQLAACAVVNATTVCSSQGACDMSYANQTLELGCDCNPGRLGEFCEVLACGVTNCNPPFGTCHTTNGGGSGFCTCETQGTLLKAGPDCLDDVTSACGFQPAGSNEHFLCNLQGTCNKSNITNLYSCTCNSGWTGSTCGVAPCSTPCNHGRCVVINNAPTCQCALGWNALPSNNPCSVSVCSGPAAPEFDVFTGSTPQCLCNNRTLAYPGCTSPECPFDSNDVRCGKVHPLASTTDINSCVNGVCQCHWSSIYNNATGLCDPRCSPTQSNGVFTQTSSVNFVPNSSPRRFLSCTCKTGFYAPTGCYDPICLNGGVYIPSTGQCACRGGFAGARCDQVVCNGHGILNTTSGQCSCFTPFNGVDCGSNYCQHSGVPDPLISGDIAPNERCRCPAAWSGQLCTASMCGTFGTPDQADPTFCDCSTPVFGGTFCNVTQCNPLTGVFDPTFVRCNCTDLQYYGVLCGYRKCGPAGVWDPFGSPTNTSHPANCTCITPVVTQDPITGNCTKSLCGPFGSLSSNWLTCNCQANHTRMIGRTSPGHSIICEPICLNGGFYNDTRQACVCPLGFIGSFCETSGFPSSSSSTGTHSSSSSSSTAVHHSSSGRGSSTGFHNHTSSSSTGVVGELTFPPFNISQTVIVPESTHTQLLTTAIATASSGATQLVSVVMFWIAFSALI